MIDPAICEAWLIVPNQGDAIFARDIFRRDNYKFVPVELGTKGDLLDNSARNLAADSCAVEHSREGHIVDVERSAGYLVAAFLSRY